jgi:DNA repair protein RecN (Recombination protein N)
VLHELHVLDLGIVADLTVVLGEGMTAITGETGAGKTLLVEAVELLVGGRADAGLVRDGADEARVEGRFTDPDTGDEVVLARVIPRDGRSRAYIDGNLATVAQLAETGARLVDLHGQHAHQSLLDPAVQRRALDRSVGAPAADALAAFREARAAIRQCDGELAALGGDERARAREVDLLRFQTSEISEAAIADADEDTTLAAEEALLADAVAHREALTRAYEALEGPALDALGEAVAALDGPAPFAALAGRVRAAQAEVADIGSELRVQVDAVEEDPERVETVRRRRQLLHDLMRKYGETLAEVIEYGRDAAARLAELEGWEAAAAALETRRAGHEQAAATAATALTKARTAAAGPLARAIEVHLHELAMPHARLEVAVEPGEPSEDGTDRVTFLLAANPGESARPLAKAASGGELSRAMLAARVVLTEAPPTLVFDEIDAGIGGEAGVAVGRLLGSIGDKHQVLCVTHLAQVAAFADTQVVVEKQVVLDNTRADDADGTGDAPRTVAAARVVTGDDRVAELSRMLAGDGASSHARKHAAELLGARDDGRPSSRARSKAPR